VNWAYTREHDAVATMAEFSWRQPRQFLVSILHSPPWLLGFGTDWVLVAAGA